MKMIKGDLIKKAMNGDFDVIVHGCNCFNTMGAGIAQQVKHYFPEAFIDDQGTHQGDVNKLGLIRSVPTSYGVIVVNAYTQYDYRFNKINVDYSAITSCMIKIKKEHTGKRIGLPLIGCGLAGGDWNVVSSIINKELAGEDVTIAVIDSFEYMR